MRETSTQSMDDSIDQQAERVIPDATSSKWRRHIDSARIVWAKLTADELLQSDGQLDKLTILVEERYAISRETAQRRVEGFLYQFGL
jgi:uncharacterized protein YjbJ (UPF0337 family)